MNPMMNPGEVRRIGPHVIACGGVEDPQVEAMLDPDATAGRKVRVLYSDPPWGDGNLSYWVTMNKKMTGNQFVPLKYDVMLNRFRDIIERYVDGWVFIETGVRWEAKVVDLLGQWGMSNVKSRTMMYRGGAKLLPCILVSATTSGDYRPSAYDPMGDMGATVPLKAVADLALRPGSLILDPCCGMGYTAQAAIDLRHEFRGNEFNAKRLLKTEERLQRGRKP